MAYNSLLKTDDEQRLAYDLRVYYAMIAGRKMLEIEEAIQRKDYSAWFNQLRLMFPIIFSRVDRDRDAIKTKYTELLENSLKVINKYERCYLKKSHNYEEMWEVEEVLMTLQHFLYRVLHTTNQFGSERDIKGL